MLAGVQQHWPGIASSRTPGTSCRDQAKAFDFVETKQVDGGALLTSYFSLIPLMSTRNGLPMKLPLQFNCHMQPQTETLPSTQAC